MTLPVCQTPVTKASANLTALFCHSRLHCGGAIGSKMLGFFRQPTRLLRRPPPRAITAPGSTRLGPIPATRSATATRNAEVTCREEIRLHLRLGVILCLTTGKHMNLQCILCSRKGNAKLLLEDEVEEDSANLMMSLSM